MDTVFVVSGTSETGFSLSNESGKCIACGKPVDIQPNANWNPSAPNETNEKMSTSTVQYSSRSKLLDEEEDEHVHEPEALACQDRLHDDGHSNEEKFARYINDIEHLKETRFIELFMQATKRGASLMYMAAMYNDSALVRLLLNRGMSVEQGNEDTLSTPLQTAVYHGHHEMVQLLLAAGANPHEKNMSGRTALHTACMTGNLPMCFTLILYGADPDITDDDGVLPSEYFLLRCLPSSNLNPRRHAHVQSWFELLVTARGKRLKDLRAQLILPDNDDAAVMCTITLTGPLNLITVTDVNVDNEPFNLALLSMTGSGAIEHADNASSSDYSAHNMSAWLEFPLQHMKVEDVVVKMSLDERTLKSFTVILPPQPSSAVLSNFPASTDCVSSLAKEESAANAHAQATSRKVFHLSNQLEQAVFQTKGVKCLGYHSGGIYIRVDAELYQRYQEKNAPELQQLSGRIQEEWKDCIVSFEPASQRFLEAACAGSQNFSPPTMHMINGTVVVTE